MSNDLLDTSNGYTTIPHRTPSDCVKTVHLVAFASHPPNVEKRWLMPFFVYCDESHDERSNNFFTFCGYLAEEDVWKQFSIDWQRVLDTYKISDFHAVDCESGSEQFKGMSFEKRQDIQRDLIGVITTTNLLGIPCGIDLTEYNKHVPLITELRKLPLGLPESGSLGAAYYLAMQLLVERIKINSLKIGVQENEQIAFIFDRHLQYQGRTPALINSLRQSTTLDFVSGIGATTHAPSTGKNGCIPIQASDFLAYEFFRFASEQSRIAIDRSVVIDKSKMRWQWDLLRTKNCDEGRTFDHKAIESVL